jgi:hypothetical protein
MTITLRDLDEPINDRLVRRPGYVPVLLTIWHDRDQLARPSISSRLRPPLVSGSHIAALVLASLGGAAGVLMVLLRHKISRKVTEARKELGLHTGLESEPSIFVAVGLMFIGIFMATVVLTIANS